MGSIPVIGDRDMSQFKWLKWSVVIILMLAIGAGTYFYQNGDIPQKLYENKKERLASLQPLPGMGAGDIAVTKVHVIDMTSEQTRDNYTVMVRDGRITALGPASEIDVPASIEAIDGSGAYLMPGLADMHVHTSGIPLAYSLFLANGITTIRETSGMAKYLEWSRGVEEGEILGPTIYTTGPTLHGSSSEEPRGNPDAVLTTADEIRTEVANQYEAGYRILKLYDFLSAEAFRAAMEEAKARGMYTVGHVPYSVGIEGVTEAGMDELAHIHSFHQDFFKHFDPENVFDEYPIEEHRIPEIVAMVKAAGTRICVTLIVNQALLDSQDLDSYLQRPMQSYELPWAEPYMRSAAWYFNKMWPGPYLEETYLPWLYRLTKALHDAGVMLVLGTDSGVTGLVHGFSTQEELSLLVKAGLSPYEALLTGTRNAAIASGDGDDWGTIEVGKRADMILLADNPLDDIRNAQRIMGVIKAGRWLDREELDRMLDDVLRAY